ncbi:MAG: phosphoserine phosphatase SerB [Desulfobacterales bacterium]|nr:phosphoserine phosphatase SerB [Desulfobacterales bacterium]
MNRPLVSELYVISATGKDQAGLLHRVARVLSDLGINIVDIDARSIRGYFTMFLVVDLGTSAYSARELLDRLSPLGLYFDLGLHVKPYDEGRRIPNKQMMLMTLMGNDRTGIVAELSGLVAEHQVNIEAIKMIARGDYIAMEISLDTSALDDVKAFRKVIYAFSEKSGFDVSLRKGDIFQKPKRVVIFDCDSTIIKEEVIDELAKVAGVERRVKRLTTRAMSGEIDFEKALRQRVQLLKGLTVDQLEKLTQTIHLTPGAEELISALRFMGFKVGVISGGFSFFTNYLKERLNLDYVYANELEIENGVTTGRIKGKTILSQSKADIIHQIAEMENISVEQIVAVGDGANDRFMLQKAGLAIAFNPKEILKDFSDGIITSDNISGLLYFLGAPDDVLKKFLNKEKDA